MWENSTNPVAILRFGLNYTYVTSRNIRRCTGEIEEKVEYKELAFANRSIAIIRSKHLRHLYY